jgi:putative cell wall-binding protein
MMYLNHSRAELKKMPKSKLVSIGTQILKRFPKKALPGTIYVMEQSAKRYGIKSIGKIAKKVKRKAKSVKRKAKSVRRRAKTAMSYPRSKGGTRYTNGRTFKSRKKSKKVGIYTAKNGRQYRILASGQARFI